MDKTFKIQFDADLHINKIKGALTDLQKNLNQLKLPDSMFTSTTKDIAKLENYIKDFQSLANKTSFSTKDVDNLVKTYSKIEDLTRKLNIDTQAINGLNINKLLPPEMAQRLEQLKGLLEEVQKLIDFKDNKPKQLQALTDELGVTEKKVDELKNKLKELNEIKEQTNKNLINNRVEQTNLKEQLKALQEKKKALEKPRGKGSKEYKDNEKELDKLEQKAQALQIKIDGLKQKLVGNPNNNSYITASTDLKGKQNELANIQTQIEALSRANEGIARRKPGTQLKEYQDLVTQINELISKLEDLKIKENEIKAAQKETGSSISSTTSELDNETEKIANLKTQIDNLNNNNLDVEKFNQIRQALADMMGVDISQIPTNLEDVKNIINQLSDEKLKAIKIALEGTAGSSQNLTEILKQLGIELGEVKDQSEQFNDQMREVSALKTRIQYFFGLNNAINLVKRAVRGAFDTIKELDKAMTETAVVTNFSVGDMWEQLPEYTKRANELGVTTLAAYEAATLYYQQGLKTNEVNALSVETLKMARIAGLDAAEATDRMTNALRGFNMELTEANAQRVDDVYSELAANTASNVDEISTAMTKVASLAHNANMEFETTAAFLAQIIETTRESAETAGTALKTVVARFSEVKKLVDEGTLRGTDEEGQTIDVNRVGAALRTAGIDLNKYFLGEVGLDDIFVELASKWDSLTSVQQRYIATQAAGSRQQSRFIALMQDYARTQELVGKAYDANGASARQFAKTQESLESKLNKLKNAWNEFLMGLTNNEMVKGFIDILTNLLNFLNKITSGFDSTTNSILKFTAALAGFVGLKSLFKSGGILDNVLGAVTQNTMFGAALGKIGIGGKHNGAAEVVAQQMGATAGEGAKRTPLIFGSGSLLSKGAKSLWGGFQTLGTKAGLSGGLLGKAAGGLDASIMSAGGSAELAMGLTGVATALGAVAIAVGLVVAGYQAWLHLTPEGQLKQAKKIAEVMNETAANTQNAANEMKQARDQYRQYTDAVNNASNIEERNEAIQNRNEYINSLLEQNEAFAKYVSTEIQDGQLILTVNDDSLNEAIQTVAEAAARAATGSDFANSMQSGKQADIFEARIRRAGVNLENRTIRDYDEYGNETTRALTDAEYAKFAQYAQAAENARAEQRTYAAQGYGRQLEGSGLEDDVASMLASAMADAFDEDQYLKDINSQRSENWWNSQATLKQLRADYKDLYGIDAGKMKRGKLASAVAQGQVDRERGENLKHLTGLLSGVGGEGFAKALSMYLGREDFSNINLTLSNIGDLSLLSDDVDLTQLAEGIGIVGDELGTADQKLKEIIKQNIQSQKEYQQKFNTGTAQKVISIGNNLGWDQNETASAIADILALQSFEEQKAIGDLLSSITNDQIAGTILQNLDDSGLREWISNLDFSNPINGLLQLQEAAKTGTDQIQILGKELQQESEFSASSLLSYFTTSSDYESLTEDLQKFREENGKISSTNILELAESNKTLNDLLKTGAISAKALAVALNGIESNEIQVWDLNDAIIAALNSMDDLDSVVKRTIDDLNNFDPGYDENDVTSFINKIIENATGNIEKGAWGNNQMRNYMEYIFGEYTGDPGEQYQNWIASGLTWLQNNKDNMESAWMDIAGSSVESAAVYGDGVKIWEENGEILIDAAGHTTDELVKILTEGTQLTEQQIRMMVTDYKNYSDDFALLLERADTEKAVNEWASKITERGYYLDTELEALAKLLGKDVTEIQKTLGEGFKTNYEVTWGEDLTTNVDNVLKKLNKDYKTSRAEAWNVPETAQRNASAGYYKEELINFNQLKQSMAEADLSGYFEQTLNEMTKDSDTFWADFGNGLEEVKIQAGETAMEAYTKAAEESARQALATAIGDAVVEALKNEHNIEIGADTDSATDKVNALFNVIDDYVNSNHDIVINGNTDSASAAINNLASAYKNLADGIKAVKNAGSGGGATQEGEAKGGIVGSYGSGSYRVSPGPALTGEEGPEIVWNKEQGYAYITGQDHPEFQNLQPGDRIFDAKETKKILSLSKGGFVHSYSDPSHGYEKDPKKELGYTGTGDEKYKKESTWRNELDWLYDLMEDIAELERRQEIIQSRYDIYLKDVTKTGRDLYNLTKAELTNLQTQLQGQQTAQIKRLQQMGELMQQYPQYKDYVKWNDKDKTLEINWDKIEGIQDKDTYDAVTDLVSRAETIQDQMDDAEKSIWDIRKQIQDLQNRYLQQYLDFQNRVLEAVVQQYQDTIDNLSELNDTLNDTNRSILESIQREIDLERQIRDNTNTENQIAEMEARLAYLQRDTTGANASEIRALQKQLDEARENYNDTLVDQAVERLSQANDDAAVQREKQIELMQAQLDYWKESGGLWDEVISLIAEGFTSDGTLIQGSRLEEVLKNAEGYEAMSQAQRDNWANELILETNEVGAHLIQLNEGLKISTETIRAILLRLEGKMGGTPEHSYTAEKTEEKYATGGLNTYTGWAHLDGTPSEPEYVLNARQTDAFLRLADILPAAMNGTAPLTNNYGGNIYLDLNMHVDEIANDYDVDRIADRVKEIIYDAGSYRNVNTLNFIR